MILPPFWEWTGSWTVAFLLLVAFFVPRGAGMPALEDRRAQVRRLIRFALAAWVLFHLWGVWRLVNCLHDIRLLGPKATAGTMALGLSLIGQTLFAGWACLAGTVVLSGIVLRGTREGWWMPWLLLAGFAGAAAWGVIAFQGRPTEGYQPYPLPGWEVYQGPFILLSAPAAAIVCIHATYGLWRTSRVPDPQRRERERLRLAGSGIVLLSTGILFALVRGFFVAQNVIILGPRVTSRDLQAIPGVFVLPGVVVLLGVLPTLFGILHLVPRREADDPAPAPGPFGDDPAP